LHYRHTTLCLATFYLLRAYHHTCIFAVHLTTTRLPAPFLLHALPCPAVTAPRCLTCLRAPTAFMPASDAYASAYAHSAAPAAATACYHCSATHWFCAHLRDTGSVCCRAHLLPLPMPAARIRYRLRAPHRACAALLPFCAYGCLLPTYLTGLLPAWLAFTTAPPDSYHPTCHRYTGCPYKHCHWILPLLGSPKPCHLDGGRQKA